MKPPRSREAPSSSHWRAIVFIAAALALHLFLLPIVRLDALTKDGNGQTKHRTQLVIRPPSARSKGPINKGAPRPPAVTAKKAEIEKKPELDGQIVEVPPSRDDRAPENAKYLSERNTRAERETRSRHASADYQNVMNEPSTTRAPQLQGAQANPEAKALEVGPPRPSKEKEAHDSGDGRALELPRLKQRDRLALARDPNLGMFRNHDESTELQGNSDRLRLSPGTNGEAQQAPGSAPTQGPSMADLIPSVGVLARVSGGPTNDLLEGLEEGEGTFLNSREFKYASFFNRLKRGVSQQWRPLDEYNRRDPSGQIYGNKTRRTVVAVTLRPDGSLFHVEVSRSSGVDFLDHEALEAFQHAEPFSNPPKALVDTSGFIVFSFSFQVEFNGNGGLY